MHPGRRHMVLIASMAAVLLAVLPRVRPTAAAEPLPCVVDAAALPGCLADLAERAAAEGPFGRTARGMTGLAENLALAGKIQAARDATRRAPDGLEAWHDRAIDEIEVVLAARAHPDTPASLARFAPPFDGSGIADRLRDRLSGLTSRYPDLQCVLQDNRKRHPPPRTATLGAVLARWEREISLFPSAQRRAQWLKLIWPLTWSGDIPGARRGLAAAEALSTADEVDESEMTLGWLAVKAPDEALRSVRRMPLADRGGYLVPIAQLYLDKGDPAMARLIVEEAYASVDAGPAPPADAPPEAAKAWTERRLWSYRALVSLQARLGDRDEVARREAMAPGLQAFMLLVPNAPTFCVTVLQPTDRHEAPDWEVIAPAVEQYRGGAREEALAALRPLDAVSRDAAGEQLVKAGLDCGHAEAAVAEVAEALRLPSPGRLRLAAAARCLWLKNPAGVPDLLERALGDGLVADDAAALAEIGTAAALAGRPDLAVSAIAAAAALRLRDPDPGARASGLAALAAQAAALFR